ncbi:MAG: sensor histidine kinase [Synechococcaceae cyanobacterium SM2_3_1]|nr:sensor histidine kinase [Synechococcaceae cyanobacterium SM2_3_1]
MNRFIRQIHQHPFPLLLSLEWTLLGLGILAELLPALPQFFPSPLAMIPLILTYGLMGLFLPVKNRDKILYTLLEGGLILVVSLLGNVRLYASLYVPLLVRSCLIFNWRGRLIVGGFTLLMFVLSVRQRLDSSQQPYLVLLPSEYVNYVVATLSLVFILSMIFLILMINSLVVERRAREQLSQANRQLRQYAQQIEQLATVQERNRIAREIHDSLGHSLTALNIQLEGVLKLWQAQPEQAHQFLKEAKQLGRQALQDVRQSVSALRSDTLSGASLKTEITHLIQQTQESTGIQITTQLELDPQIHLGSEVQNAVYRIIQEATTNSCKHAEATLIKVYLRTTPTLLSLSVQDNGKGFQPQQNSSGYGLQGMRERAQSLQGSLLISSQPGQGCQIRLQLPLSSQRGERP